MHPCAHLSLAINCHVFTETVIGASLSEPHTSDMNGTSDRLRTVTIKHGKFINSSIDSLNYTTKWFIDNISNRNGLLTIHHKTGTCIHHMKNNR